MENLTTAAGRARVGQDGPQDGARLQDVRLEALYLACPHCRALNRQERLECRSCGLIFMKWRRPVVEVGAPPSSSKPSLRALAAGAALLVLGAFAASRPPSMEIGSQAFEGKVLQASTPVLVMFNALPDCHCAEEELLALRDRWQGKVAVYSLNASDCPELGRRFGIEQEPIVMLFQDGRLLKKENAVAMEERATAPGGEYSSAAMIAELEAFAK